MKKTSLILIILFLGLSVNASQTVNYDDLSYQQQFEFEQERQEYIARSNAKYPQTLKGYGAVPSLLNMAVSGVTQSQSPKTFLRNNAYSLLYTVFNH